MFRAVLPAFSLFMRTDVDDSDAFMSSLMSYIFWTQQINERFIVEQFGLSCYTYNGYTVLNLIEIRRPYKDEKLTQIITVGEHEFDY